MKKRLWFRIIASILSVFVLFTSVSLDGIYAYASENQVEEDIVDNEGSLIDEKDSDEIENDSEDENEEHDDKQEEDQGDESASDNDAEIVDEDNAIITPDLEPDDGVNKERDESLASASSYNLYETIEFGRTYFNAGNVSDEITEKLKNQIGYYDVDGKTYYSNGKNVYNTIPNRWIIVDDMGDSFLVIAEYILFGNEFSPDFTTNWETSAIRKKINTTAYLDTYFSKEEQEDILKTTISGNDFTTEDKLFLPSAEEVGMYLDGEMRVGHYYSTYVPDVTTPFNNAYNKGDYACAWWTRSVDHMNYGFSQPTYVDSLGSLKYGGRVYCTWHLGIRPMMRIKKESPYIKEAKEKNDVPYAFTTNEEVIYSPAGIYEIPYNPELFKLNYPIGYTKFTNTDILVGERIAKASIYGIESCPIEYQIRLIGIPNKKIVSLKSDNENKLVKISWTSEIKDSDQVEILRSESINGKYETVFSGSYSGSYIGDEYCSYKYDETAEGKKTYYYKLRVGYKGNSKEIIWGEYSDVVSVKTEYIKKLGKNIVIPKGRYGIFIVDKDDKPISGVSVKYNEEELITDSKGYAEFKFVDNPRIEITKEGYITWSNTNSNWRSSIFRYEVIKLYEKGNDAEYLLKNAYYKASPNSTTKDLLQQTVCVPLRATGNGGIIHDFSDGTFEISCEANDKSLVHEYILMQKTTSGDIILAESEDGMFKLDMSKMDEQEGGGIYILTIPVGKPKSEKYKTDLYLEFIEPKFGYAPNSLSIGNKGISFTVDHNCPFIGGETISMNLPDVLPFEFYLDDEKVYGGINVPLKDKKSLDDVNKLVKDLKNLKSIKLNEEGRKTLEKNIPDKKVVFFNEKVKIKFFGLIEADYGSCSLKGDLFFLVSWKFLGKENTVLVHGFPITYDVGAKLDLETGVDFGYDLINNDFVHSFRFEPAIKLEAYGGPGVGKAISGGAYGQAELRAQFEMIEQNDYHWNTVDINGEFGAKAYVAYMEFEQPLASFSKNLYRYNSAMDNSVSLFDAADIYDADNYSVSDLSYTKNEVFYEKLDAQEKNDSSTINTFIKNTYNNAQPATCSDGENIYLCMLRADDKSGDIFVSIAKFNGESWSEVKRLDSDSVLDDAPKMCVSKNGELYIVYSRNKNNLPIGEEKTLLKYAQNRELIVANIDKSTLDIAKYKVYGANDYIRSYDIANIENDIVVTWQECKVETDDDVLSSKQSELYMTRIIEGNLGEAEHICSVNKTVTQIIAGKYNGNSNGVAFTALENDNNQANEILYWAQKDRIIKLADVENSKVKYAKLPSGNSKDFIWKSKFLETKDGEEKLETGLISLSGSSVAIDGITDQWDVTDDSIFYVTGALIDSNEKFATYIHEVKYVSGNYGEPLLQEADNRYFENISSQSIGINDYIFGVNTSASIKYNGIAISKDIVWLQSEDVSNLEVIGCEYDESGKNEGETIPISITLKNVSAHTIESVDVNIGTTTIKQIVYIEPGCEKCIEIELLYPNKQTSYRITVNETGKKNTSDKNIMSFTLGMPDVEIDATYKSSKEKKEITVFVTNVGGGACSGEISIKDKDGMYYQFDNTSFQNLNFGDTAVFYVIVSEDEIDRFMGEIEIEAYTYSRECDYTNNIKYLNTAYGEEKANVVHTENCISSNDVSWKLEFTEAWYTGETIKPIVTGYDNTRAQPLIENNDYIVEYLYNIEPGVALVRLTGINNYHGTKTLRFVIYSSVDDERLIKRIVLNSDRLSLKSGETATISAQISPINSGEKLRWSVSDDKIAWIEETDDNHIVLLHAKAEGYVRISVYSYETSSSISFNIQSSGNKPISSISFDSKDISLGKNDRIGLNARYTPEDADASKIVWTSSDNNIVTIEGSGSYVSLIALDEGKATITASSGKAKAEITVNVSAPVRLDKHNLTLISKENSTATLTATVKDKKYNVDTLIWNSSDEKVVTVNKGEVTAAADLLESKTAVITVTTPDYKYSDSCEVTVLVAGMTLTPKASVLSGEVDRNTKVFLNCETLGAEIYYTIDGTEPSVDVNKRPLGTTRLYSDAITINRPLIIKAIAICEGYKDSKVESFAYTVKQDWGDVSDSEIKHLFKDSLDIPEDIWYVFGNEQDGYTKYYTASDKIDITKPYNGSKITFNNDIHVFHGTRRLWENRDYTVSYVNNQLVAGSNSAKAPAFIIKGKGSYTKNSTFKFSIVPEDIDNAEISSERNVSIALGTKIGSVKPVITYEGKKLSVGKDYDLIVYKGSVSDSNKITDPVKTTANAGDSFIFVITGHKGGNFTGTKAQTITVRAVNTKDKSIVQMSKVKVNMPKAKDLPYKTGGYSIVDLFDNSNGKNASVSVMNGKERLVFGRDFTVDDEVYEEAGKHIISVHGLGDTFIGDKLATLEISGIAAGKVKVAGLRTNIEYSGKEYVHNELYTPDKVTSANRWNKITLYTIINKSAVILEEGKDYDVELINNGATGKINVEYKFKGRFIGSLKKAITVKPRSISGAVVTATSADYSKAGAIPSSVTVKLDNLTLREGIDYTLSYKNNTKAGVNATVTVKGIGNYIGSKNATYMVNKSEILKCVTLVSADKVYNAKAKAGYFKSVPKLMDDGKAISVGKDIDKLNTKTAFKYYYASTGEEISDNTIVPANTTIEVRVTVNCGNASPYKAGQYELKGYYKIIDTGKDIKSAKVVMKNKNIQFNNGKAIIPLKESDLIVTVGKQVLSASDYEIVSIKNNRFLGTATVEIRGKGAYGGTKKFTFKINARALK